MLTAWKKTDELGYLNEVSSVPLQQTLRHLQGAFTNFFAKRAGYPRFKSKHRSRAYAEYTSSAFRFRNRQLILAKMTRPLVIVWSRPLPEGATDAIHAGVQGRLVWTEPGRGRPLVPFVQVVFSLRSDCVGDVPARPEMDVWLRGDP